MYLLDEEFVQKDQLTNEDAVEPQDQLSYDDQDDQIPQLSYEEVVEQIDQYLQWFDPETLEREGYKYETEDGEITVFWYSKEGFYPIASFEVMLFVEREAVKQHHTFDYYVKLPFKADQSDLHVIDNIIKLCAYLNMTYFTKSLAMYSHDTQEISLHRTLDTYQSDELGGCVGIDYQITMDLSIFTKLLIEVMFKGKTAEEALKLHPKDRVEHGEYEWGFHNLRSTY